MQKYSSYITGIYTQIYKNYHTLSVLTQLVQLVPQLQKSAVSLLCNQPFRSAHKGIWTNVRLKEILHFLCSSQSSRLFLCSQTQSIDVGFLCGLTRLNKVETKKQNNQNSCNHVTLISLLLESLRIIKILFHLLMMHINCVFCLFVCFVLGVVRPISRTPLGDLKQSNAPVDRMYK